MPSIMKCYRCQEMITDDDEYQLIFDKIGLEMNIKNLLNECYHIHIKKNDELFQGLCETCLNDLIETFDRLECEKLKTSKSSNYSILDKFDSDNSKSSELNDDYMFDETKNDSESDTQKIDDDVDDMKCVDYIIEDICDDEHSQDNILAEFTIDNDNDDDENSIKNDNSEENDQKIFLSIDYNEENCDDPDDMEIITNRDEYEEIDYLDDVDDITKLQEYLQKSLCDFKDITLPQLVNCRLCNESLDTHGRLLAHCKAKHRDDESKFECIFSKNCEKINSYQDLSSHLLLKHYDLHILTVYSQCLHCTKRFNNLIMLNKHSCYDSKNVSRSATECNTCDKTFRSNKRYRFHLQFHLDKYRPKACLICRKFYDDDDELFEHVMYEREPEDSLICKLCDRNFLQLDTFDNHKNVHHLKRPYACTFCDKTYLSSQQLQDHLNTQHLQKKIYKCYLCSKEFFKRNILQKHIQSHKEPVEVSVFCCSDCGFLGKNRDYIKTHIDEEHSLVNSINIVASMLKIGYCCEYCEMSFNSIKNLLLHRNKHDNNLFECPLCTSTFDSYKKAKNHRQTHQKYIDIRKILPITRHYVCDFENCTNNYVQWITLVSHKRNTHLMGKQKPFKCEECNVACSNKRYFTQHMQEKHGQQPEFPCSFCPKTYTTSMAIAVHIARMHNNSKLSCDHCGTLCKNKEALEKHITNTHEILTCNVCDKVLKNMKNLRTHIKMVHKKEKRYFCQYCKRGYYNNCDRLTHEQAIHIKNKVFTCEICPYTTPYRESILVHQKNHSNTKPYECFLCHKKFARRYSLTLHQRRHAEVRKYICPYKDCDNSYPNQGILNLHMRNKHADETCFVTKGKTMPVKKSKLAQILKKGIPDDYLTEENDITDENDLNFIDEINSDSEETYLTQNDDDDNIKDDDDNNIEYIFTELKEDDVCNIINNDEENSNEYMEDVEIDDSETIILNENDEHNYILREDDDEIIEGYEIIEE